MPLAWNQSDDQTVRPATFWGEAGWWRVPRGWSMWEDSFGSRWASPNADRSGPVYACKLNENGFMVFQDLMRSLVAGT